MAAVLDDLRVRVGEVGLVARPNHGRPTVWIAAIDGRGCTATSEKLQGSAVGEVVVDHAGRVWAATDHALAVLAKYTLWLWVALVISNIFMCGLAALLFFTL